MKEGQAQDLALVEHLIPASGPAQDLALWNRDIAIETLEHVMHLSSLMGCMYQRHAMESSPLPGNGSIKEYYKRSARKRGRLYNVPEGSCWLSGALSVTDPGLLGHIRCFYPCIPIPAHMAYTVCNPEQTPSME